MISIKEMKLVNKAKTFLNSNKDEVIMMKKSLENSTDVFNINVALRRYLIGAMKELQKHGVEKFWVDYQGKRKVKITEELLDLDNMVKEGRIGEHKI